MPIANPFELGRAADRSEEINIIPIRWGLVNSLGLFQHRYGTTKTALVPRTTEEDVLIEDRNWNERDNAMKGIERDVLPLQIPHYPLDDAITPQDLDGQIDWRSITSGGNGLVTLDSVRAEKMERIRRAHANTLEFARAQAIKDGTVFAPNGTVVTNYYDEFGVTREVFDFELNSATEVPKAKVDAVLRHIREAVGGATMVGEVVAICSPEFFSALTTNPFVFESYQYFSQPQGSGVLNQRLDDNPYGLNNYYQSFRYGGITFIEIGGEIAGRKFVEAGEAYAFPLGTNLFRTYFAPAERFGIVNTTAVESYYFEHMDEKRSIIEIMTETNFLNALLCPDAVVTLEVGS